MKTTEQPSHYDHIESMSVHELLVAINKEDATVAGAVAQALPQIEALVPEIVSRLEQGGRLFYIGAGTSGRLGVVDASEVPPTFGMDEGVVVGIIAGGDGAIRKAVEFAEDDYSRAWDDLQAYRINAGDIVIGLAASGSTPYVIGGVRQAMDHGLVTGCITCNHDTLLARSVAFPIEVIVGPEFITGSTRMKAGTAQKLVLNMISTSVMVQLGRVKGNKMVNMQLNNRKLTERGIRMLIEELHIGRGEAEALLATHGSVRKAIESVRDKA